MRGTLSYQFTADVSAGVEYNPYAEEVGVIGNWRVLPEDGWRPALMVGTSSDRIGTTDGQAYYATLSKSLEREMGLPIAPYFGIAYGEARDEFKELAGLGVYWSDTLSSLTIWDGYSLHQTLEYQFGRHAIGLLLADVDDQYYLGLTYNVRFGMPWESR